MCPDWSRRDVLRTGSVALPALVAGCGGSGGGPGGGGSGGGSPTDSGPDPDRGNGSYGVLARNVAPKEHRLQVTVTLPWEEKTVFRKTVSLSPDSRREWDAVVDENEEFAFTAALDGAIDGRPDDRAKQRLWSDNLWLTPGSETAPAVPNVEVVVHDVDVDQGTMTAVSVTAGEDDG